MKGIKMGLRYWLWKRRVRKISPAKCSICCICEEPIYPGEFVGGSSDGRLVHAGFHFSLKQGKDSFCETGAIGTGFWDGSRVEHITESSASIAMRTGKAVIRTIWPDGIKDTLIEMPQITNEKTHDLLTGKTKKP